MAYKILQNDGEVLETELAHLFSVSEKTLLYFYPKDSTPGCTTEAQDFTRLLGEFRKKWIRIIWVSKDSLESHWEFRISCALWIDLLSDPEGALHDKFWVIWEKNMYGKKIVWVIRSTFLLDSSGNILKEWRNVRATGHAEKVLLSI